MAAISKLRKHSALLFVIIFVALMAFVLGDFLKSCKRGKKGTGDFGQIAGEKIIYREFEKNVDEKIAIMEEQSYENNISAEQRYQIRQDVWDELVRNTIMQNELNGLGLSIIHDEAIGYSISKEELENLVFSRNPHPIIAQNFADPKTGRFDPNNVNKFLMYVEKMENSDDYEQRELAKKQDQQWQKIKKYIRTDRLNTKYFNLIKNGFYVPQNLAKQDYNEKRKTAHIHFFAVKYNTIPDSSINVSQKEIENYYNEHKYKYEQEKSRDLEYVAFDILPSAKDYKNAKQEIYKIKKELETLETDDDIENFVNINSDAKYDSSFFKNGELSKSLDSIMFNSPKGTIVSPYIENNTYYLAKLIDIQDRPDSVKAKHILISYKDAGINEKIIRTKEEAKIFADSILNIVKNQPDKFEELVMTTSEYPKKEENKGDLGWITDGDANFYPFYNACLTGEVGDFKIVETNLGYHIMCITEKTESIKKVQVAIVQRTIQPSDETFQDIYSIASKFVGKSTSPELFKKNADNNNFGKKTVRNIKEMDNNISGLDESRELIRWAFNEDTKTGSISVIFTINDKYVIALLTKVSEKGIVPLEQIQKEMEFLTKKEKKAEILTKKINSSMTSSRDIYKLANKFNTKVDKLDNITFSSYTLPPYGSEPNVIGTVFSLNKNELSNPIKGQQGIFVVLIDKFVELPATKDYSINKMQLTSYFKSRAHYDVFKALKENADVIDNRKDFY
jgi:peptidyl-prolyl cis-trans isomerase D